MYWSGKIVLSWKRVGDSSWRRRPEGEMEGLDLSRTGSMNVSLRKAHNLTADKNQQEIGHTVQSSDV